MKPKHNPIMADAATAWEINNDTWFAMRRLSAALRIAVEALAEEIDTYPVVNNGMSHETATRCLGYISALELAADEAERIRDTLENLPS